MSALRPFAPNYNSGQTVSSTGTAATATIRKNALNVAITNTGSNIAYIRISDDATLAATVADFPVLAGNQVIITKSEGHDKISHISASDTTLHIITGEGW